MIGALVAFGIGAWQARFRSAGIIYPFVALLCALIGARALSYLLHSDGSLPNSGFALDGGIALGAIGVFATSILLSSQPLPILDGMALAAPAGIAIAKFGCVISGCCYGLPTNYAWGISIEPGSHAHLAQIVNGKIDVLDAPLPLHPAQFYEIIAAVAMYIIVLLLLKKKVASGIASATFGTLFFGVRACAYFWREPDISARLSPTIVSLLLGLVSVLFLVLILWNSKTSRMIAK